VNKIIFSILLFAGLAVAQDSVTLQIAALKAERDAAKAQVVQLQSTLGRCMNLVNFVNQQADQAAGVDAVAKAKTLEQIKQAAQKACNGTLDADYACVLDKSGTK
jgi:hypothetical protein